MLFPIQSWTLSTVTFHDNYTHPPPTPNDLVVKCEAGVLKKLLSYVDVKMAHLIKFQSPKTIQALLAQFCDTFV